MLRRRQRGGFMAHRPDCHELEDVVKTELQARPWSCRKGTALRTAEGGRGYGAGGAWCLELAGSLCGAVPSIPLSSATHVSTSPQTSGCSTIGRSPHPPGVGGQVAQPGESMASSRTI